MTSLTTKDGGTTTALQPVNASFDPKEDITAYELARILCPVHNRPLYESDWQALGTLTRHFKRYS